MKKSPFILAILLLVSITGCAALGVGGYDPQKWFAHQQRNKALHEWRILAAVHVTSPNAENAFGISWLQKDDVFDVYLIPPGSPKAAAHIVGKPDAAEVFMFEPQDIDGAAAITVKERHAGGNVDQLVLDKLRLLLPVSGLVHWLRGLEKPGGRGASLASVGNKNRLDFLMQDGWEVTYRSYGDYEGHQLPDRITLASHQLKGFRIEMEIVRWQFRDFDKR